MAHHLRATQPVNPGQAAFRGQSRPGIGLDCGSLLSRLPPIILLELQFAGSLGGLIALAEGKADLAGSHLWDQETDSYNVSFVRRVLPGQRVALLTLAQRRLGLITPVGNPLQISQLGRPAKIGRGICKPPARLRDARLAGCGHAQRADRSKSSQRIRDDAPHPLRSCPRLSLKVRPMPAFGLQTAALAFGLDLPPSGHRALRPGPP